MAGINLLLVGVAGLIGLFEILYTVFNFDEDKFGVVYIALVFVLQPLITYVVQVLLMAFITGVTFSVTPLNVVLGVFEIASESIQCWLYIHFCSYSDQAILCLVLAAVAQIVLKTLNAVISACSDNDDELTVEGMARMWSGMCVNTCFGTFFDGIGLLLLLIPDSPFQTKSFEVPFACLCWLVGVSLSLFSEDKDKMYKDPDMPDADQQTQLALNIWGVMGSAMFCMIPYTIMITVHFYAKSTLPVYIFAIIMGSCCLCCSSIIVCAPYWQEGKEDAEDDEEDEEDFTNME